MDRYKVSCKNMYYYFLHILVMNSIILRVFFFLFQVSACGSLRFRLGVNPEQVPRPSAVRQTSAYSFIGFMMHPH